MERVETYYPVCKVLNKKTRVDAYYTGNLNKHDLAPTYCWAGGYCHLFSNGHCVAIDYPCVPHEPL